MMAWLVTNRECLSIRNFIVVCLTLLYIKIMFGLLDLYSNKHTNVGKKHLVQKQISEYSGMGENRKGNYGPVVHKKSFQTPQVFRSIWTTHEVIDEIQYEAKETVTGTRSQSIDNVSDVFPLNDFRRYPCLEGLPLSSTNSSLTKGNCVRTINLTAIENINTENCVTLKTPKGTTPICIYPPEKDIFISKKIHQNGQWDTTLLRRLSRVFKSHTDLELLDIGCNIGVYTLTMAHQGIKVTAIDAVLENIQLLSKSVKLGRLNDKVTFIWNALSNEHKEVTLQKFKNNPGLTEIKDIKPSAVKTVDLNLTRTIMLDDILPLFKGKRVVLKMDIEGSEYTALIGGKRFFSEIDVPIIQIEVAHTKKTTGPLITEYLSSYKFRPFKDILGEFSLNSSNLSGWGSDVYFIKELNA